MELRAPAACGGCREPSISAAVEKPEDQREPERFFASPQGGPNPSPATTKKADFVKKSAFFCIFLPFLCFVITGEG